MSLIVKICGLSSEETVDAALAGGADMLGFVFQATSPRYVEPERAAALAERARGRAQIVALTVDADDMRIDEILEALEPDWLQLHGKESPERVRQVALLSGAKTMKAIGIASAGDLAMIGAYRGVADRLLLDAKPPRGADRTGGHGQAFDWTLLTGLDRGHDFMLSGGLNEGNLAEAVRIARPMGLDVSSGVESAPGRKDPDLIHRFIAAAREAEARLEEVSA
ncbi:MAG: phosphoribosylanthranilate isomerase [Bauldia sp.]|nr:phosphoribosylanthranilate isomerase [Bauldia sp.]